MPHVFNAPTLHVTTPMDGFLNLHKPTGWTSHDCVGKLRRLLHLKRIGHGGTLDPAATGVLPIALGRATRLLQYLPSGKAYQARIRFGLTTSTDDLEGEVLTQSSTDRLTLPQIEAALPAFLGTITQIPPRYSAIQVDGQRLYDLARNNETFEVPSRTVTISHLQILGWHPGPQPELDLLVTCGAGTYIRSIARDLGAALGVGGTLAQLIRTQSCGFSLADSLSLDQIETQLQQGTFSPIAPHQLLQHLPSITLPSDAQVLAWQQGKRLFLPLPMPSPDTLRVEGPTGQLLGIGTPVPEPNPEDPIAPSPETLIPSEAEAPSPEAPSPEAPSPEAPSPEPRASPTWPTQLAAQIQTGL